MSSSTSAASHPAVGGMAWTSERSSRSFGSISCACSRSRSEVLVGAVRQRLVLVGEYRRQISAVTAATRSVPGYWPPAP